MIRLLLISLTILFATMMCENPKNSKDNLNIEPPRAKTILSLGDSYTIGQSVSEAERWPNQLAKALQDSGLDVEQPKIIARTGWTTTELLSGIQNSQLDSVYELVTLLIGVNDQYRGLGINYYRDGFVKLLNKAIEFAGNDRNRVIVLSIPDYSVTPFAQGGDTARIRLELDQFNALNQELSLQAGVYYVNITPISRKALKDKTYLAPDNLHPSGKMYGEWAELVVLIAEKILDN
ncbi:SGNH/GDSL hydrolase family protein [candidate division KSB1 bacterium]|nr:SGNH/GDSL hydrolase family protein [candidate division KSB1 bacterium]